MPPVDGPSVLSPFDKAVLRDGGLGVQSHGSSAREAKSPTVIIPEGLAYTAVFLS